MTPAALRDSLGPGSDLQSLRAAIAELPQAVLITDRHGRYVGANAAACEMTGYSAAELMTKALPDLTGGTDAAVSDVLWRAFLEQGYQTGEYTLRHKDGRSVLVRYDALAHVAVGYHASFLRAVGDGR